MNRCESAGLEDFCSSENSRRFTSYEEIVQDYIKFRRNKAIRLLEKYAELDLEKAIEIIATGQLPCGKQHSHQKRLLKTARPLSKKGLLSVKEQIANAESFENLYLIVRNAIGEIYGIGALTIYDFTQRLGYRKNLEPNEVFLHCGAADGAKHLGLKWKGNSVPVERIPKAFHKLRPYEIEDCFCIYKTALKQLSSS